MTRYKRISGGERNINSGRKWTEQELKAVLELYLKMPSGMGIHEKNPKIHILSNQLNRTIRSVEAQLLMFRNIDRGGRYSWGHMSKLCVKVWNDYLKSI